MSCTSRNFRLFHVSNLTVQNIRMAKCKTISFTLRKTPIRCTYTLDGHRLDRCEQIRDLGVILDSKLTFADHVHSTVSKANRMLGLLMRSVQTSPCSRRLHFDHHAILSAYNAHVRSVLEYASVIWSGAAVSHLKRLERLQHRFLMWLGRRSMHRCPSMDYDSLLKHFKCLSIRARFTQADVVFMQSVFRGRLDCGKLVSMFSLSAPIRRTRHTGLFHMPGGRVNSVHNGFLSRLPETCNRALQNLPEADFFGPSGIGRSSIFKFVVNESGY